MQYPAQQIYNNNNYNIKCNDCGGEYNNNSCSSSFDLPGGEQYNINN